VVDPVNGLEVRIDVLQQRAAERVKRLERDCLGALRLRFAAIPRRRDHAVFHFRRGLVGKRQAQDFLAGKFRLGVQQIADALGDDASLARARSRHHDERALAMLHGGALLGVERKARRGGTGELEQVGHRGASSAPTVAQAAAFGINGQRYNNKVIVRQGIETCCFTLSLW